MSGFVDVGVQSNRQASSGVSQGTFDLSGGQFAPVYGNSNSNTALYIVAGLVAVALILSRGGGKK